MDPTLFKNISGSDRVPLPLHIIRIRIEKPVTRAFITDKLTVVTEIVSSNSIHRMISNLLDFSKPNE